MIVTEFCEKLKVISFDFAMMQIIVAAVLLQSFPIKLICCGSFNLVFLLKSITVNVYVF